MTKETNNLEEKVSSSKRKNGFFSKLKGAAVGAVLGGAILFASCANPMMPLPGKSSPSNPTQPTTETVTISGVLEDNETHSPQYGLINVYDSNKNPLNVINGIPGDKGYTNEVEVSSNGSFSFQINENSNLSGIILQAEETDSTYTTQESYVRTIDQLPKGDISSTTDPRMNPAIRVVPFAGKYSVSGLAAGGSGGGSGVPSASDCTAFQSFVTSMESPQLVKSNISSVLILENDPFNNAGGSFNTSYDLPNIESKIVEWNNIIKNNGMRKGLNLYDSNGDISPSGVPYVVINYTGPEPVNFTGAWGSMSVNSSTVASISQGLEAIIPVAPGDTNLKLGTSGTTSINPTASIPNVPINGVIENAVSYIDDSLSGYSGLLGMVSHELGNSVMALQDTYALYNNQTIMNPVVNVLTSPTDIDKKAALITYEETYQPAESIANIIGINFY